MAGSYYEMHGAVKPHFDHVELARGVLAAASYQSVTSCQEVHVKRLDTHFVRAGIPHLRQTALDSLILLREVERLEGGYLIPTPNRSVPLVSGLGLVISISPTTELERNFPNIERAGLGRIGVIDEIDELPVQPLSSWLGSDGLDAKNWVKRLLEDPRNNYAPALFSEDIEVFSVRVSRQRREPHWVRAGSSTPALWGGVGLFRVRTPNGGNRYFVGRFSSRTRFFEGPQIWNYQRLQLGLASLIGKPLTATVQESGNYTRIKLPGRPSLSVRRFLVSVCDSQDGTDSTWVCKKPILSPLVKTHLKDNGYELLYD